MYSCTVMKASVGCLFMDKIIKSKGPFEDKCQEVTYSSLCPEIFKETGGPGPKEGLVCSFLFEPEK